SYASTSGDEPEPLIRSTPPKPSTTSTPEPSATPTRPDRVNAPTCSVPGNVYVPLLKLPALIFVGANEGIRAALNVPLDTCDAATVVPFQRGTSPTQDPTISAIGSVPSPFSSAPAVNEPFPVPPPGTCRTPASQRTRQVLVPIRLPVPFAPS